MFCPLAARKSALLNKVLWLELTYDSQKACGQSLCFECSRMPQTYLVKCPLKYKGGDCPQRSSESRQCVERLVVRQKGDAERQGSPYQGPQCQGLYVVMMLGIRRLGWPCYRGFHPAFLAVPSGTSCDHGIPVQESVAVSTMVRTLTA